MFRIVAVTAAVALGGCASNPQWWQAQQSLALTGEALVGKRIAVTTQPSPPFRAGAVGDDLTDRYGINDPAAGIGRGVALRLVAERGMTLMLDEGAAADADYVIDVQTRGWALDTFPMSRSRYRLKYDAALRLIDRSSGQRLVESRCRTQHGDPDHPPTRDALTANDAALIKGYLDRATARCVDVTVREAMGLGDTDGLMAAAGGAGAVIGSPPPPPPAPARSIPRPAEPPAAAAAPAATAATTASSAAAAGAIAVDATDANRIFVPEPSPETGERPVATSSPAAAPAEPDPRPAPGTLTAAARASGQPYFLLEDTPFRDSPRGASPVMSTLPTGMEVVVRQRIYNADGEWWFIAVPGDVGWIVSPDPRVRGRR